MRCKKLILINPDWFLLLRNISQMLVQFYLVDSEGVLVSKKHHKQATFCDPKLLVGKGTTCSQTAVISLVEGVECSFAAKHVGINHIFQTSHSRVSELYKQESCNHRNKKCTLNYHPQFTCFSRHWQCSKCLAIHGKPAAVFKCSTVGRTIHRSFGRKTSKKQTLKKTFLYIRDLTPPH